MSKGLTRREFIGGMAAGAATGLLWPFDSMAATTPVQYEHLPALREMAAAKGVYFGAAVIPSVLKSDIRYKQVIVRECNMIAPQNAVKWEALHPSKDVWDFSGADQVCAFAQQHNMEMIGHVLIWHGALPGWVKRTLKEGQGEALMEEYIRTVVSRFRGQFMSWDVVNEAILQEDGRPDGLRESPWLEALGPSYIEKAFRIAAETDPDCQLIYNDWGQESYGSRPEVMLNFLRRLKEKDVPVHGVGLQSHLSAKWRLSPKQLTSFCRKASEELGLEVLITELDVTDSHLPEDIHERDKIGAEHVRIFLESVSEAVKPRQIVTWGLNDRYSWQKKAKENVTGRDVRALPLDQNNVRKEMWGVLYNYFRQLS